MRTSTSLQIRLNSMTLSGKPWTRQAWRYLIFLCKYVFLAERYAARQVLLQFHYFIGCYHPKKLKIELHQQTKLQEKQCAYFHDSCSRRHFDSPETLCAPFHFSPGWSPSCKQALSNKIDHTLQPVLKSCKMCEDLKMCEPKPPVISQQCVVYNYN